MNPGQFYKADQLVAGVHRAQGGIFERFAPRTRSGGSTPARLPRPRRRRRSRARPTSRALRCR